MKTKEMTLATMKKLHAEVNGNAKNAFNYTDTINRFKATDSGRYGKAFEINVKHYLNGNRGNSNVVSAKGKTDVKSKGVKYEIKSNCGEINADIMKNDFIIYTDNNEATFDKPEQARVIPTADFIAIIDALGLRRTKKSTNGQLKVTIQSYRNSNKKRIAWHNAISKYPTLEEWARG